MAFCGIKKDVEKACDSVTINLASTMFAVRLEALAVTPDAVNPYLIDALSVIDPNTAAYPLEASAYYPIKIDWLYNSVLQNYEVVEGTSTSDAYKQTIGPVVISDSETAEGKANVKALNSNLYAIVAPVKGAADKDATFHIYGVTNGLKFLPQATAPEFGNRVVGNFASITGGEEATPNGVNWLETNYAATLAKFINRLETVGV
jgi:hypothetical protein